MSKAKTRGKVVKSSLKAKHHGPEGRLPVQKKSINALKTKIRDTERLLKHANDLPADIRVETERALATYKQDADQIAQEKLRSKMISKYHKVRFFERQKATRILKKLTRMLNSAPSDDNSMEFLRSAIANAQIDLNYTIYSPLTEKYQSLYAGRNDKGASKQSQAIPIDVSEIAQCVKHRPPMWKIVKTCTEEGSLESLREGKLSSRYANRIDAEQSKVTKMARASGIPELLHSRSASKLQVDPKEGEESDGAFFE